MDSNPFDHHRPAFEDSAFLDRVTETKKLRELVVSKRNLLVYGLRRRGKTSLIQRVLGQLPSGFVSIYVDAQRALDDSEVGLRLLEALAATGLGRGPRFLKWSQEFLGDLSFTVVVGSPDAPVTFRISQDRAEHRTPMLDALEFIGHVAKASGKHIVVAIDEFQVVAQRLGTDGLWAMRAVVQMQKSTSYIISGSQPTILKDIVASSKRGFWTQMTEFPVKGLTILDVQKDVEKLFMTKIPDDSKAYLLQVLGDNTQRLIQVLRHAYDANAALGRPAVASAVQAAVEENAPEYERDLESMRSGLERELLFALARQPTATPTSTAWLRSCGIKASPAGVHQALRRLRDKTIDEDHRFVDALFAVYLQGPQA